MMKNHEGYHDPTAGKAIRRAHQLKRRGRGGETRRPPHVSDQGAAGVPGDTEMIQKICTECKKRSGSVEYSMFPDFYFYVPVQSRIPTPDYREYVLK